MRQLVDQASHAAAAIVLLAPAALLPWWGCAISALLVGAAREIEQHRGDSLLEWFTNLGRWIDLLAWLAGGLALGVFSLLHKTV